MTGYRKSVRAETGANDRDLEEAVTAAIKQTPWIQSTAANSDSVNQAVDFILHKIHASNTMTGEPQFKKGESYAHPAVSQRIGASVEGGIPGELSIHRIAHSQPPAVVVTGWLRGR